MDFDILKRFDDALDDKSKDIISFCLQHENLEIVSLANHAKEKATSEQTELPVTYGTIFLLPYLMKEDPKII